MRGNLLMMRWAVLNIGFSVLGCLAWKSGYLAEAWEGDSTWFTASILFLVSIGFVMVTIRIAGCSVMLDSIHGDMRGRVREFMLSKRDAMAKDTLRAKLDARLLPLEWLSYCLITIGFLAIIWGMKNGLQEIAHMEIDGATGAVQMVRVLVQHFTIALWPTVVGIVGYMALQFNIVLLQGGYNRLYTKLLETS